MHVPDKPSHIYQQVASLVMSEVQPVFQRVLDEQLQLMDAVRQAIEALLAHIPDQPGEEPLSPEALYSYSRQLSLLVEKRYEQPQAPAFTDSFSSYVSGLEAVARTYNNTHREIQKEERFMRLPEDSWRIQGYKYIKRKGRSLSRLPVKAGNLLRKIRKKEPVPYRRWLYRVPLHNLILYHYHVQLSRQVAILWQEVYRATSRNARQLWQLSDQVHTQVYTAITTGSSGSMQQLKAEATAKAAEICCAVRKDTEALQQQVDEKLAACLQQEAEEFLYHYERVGTIEMRSARFSQQALKKRKALTNRSFRQQMHLWQNTLFALHEDWRLDEEYNLLCDAMLLEQNRLEQEAMQKLSRGVVPRIEAAEKKIAEALAAIEGCGRAVKKTLNEQKSFIDQQLMRSLIPSAMASLYHIRLPDMTDRLRQEAVVQTEKISDKRGLLSRSDFSEPVKSTEINYIAPRQVVSFETLPVLQQSLYAVREKIQHDMVQVQKLINELGQISYFNLDSALSVYEQEGEQLQKPREIAEEGLQRALKSAEHVKVQLMHIYLYFSEDMRTAILEFNQRIIELKNNDYVFELKLRIARAKAVERSRALKQKSLRYLRNTLPYSLQVMKSGYNRGSSLLHTYQKKIGLEVQKKEVTTEISDFLSETETAISRLPFVYQRLFSVRTLEDAAFYEERTAEMALLREAFDNWEKGRFASTVVVGEKGSGISTLASFFLKDFEDSRKYVIVRGSTQRQYYTPEALLAYLGELLPDCQAQRLEDVVAYLLQRKQKTIFVFENMEHFYLRKVGGFQCLKMLFELISRTQKQVFWLCSCTLYTWRFLDKTIRISTYFEYVVPLNNASSEQTKAVILKRHRVSGYDIVYAPSVQEPGKGRFQKMSKREQQLYLEQEYFQDLSRITAGNFSLAQLFWLRSTVDVGDDVITIGSLKDIDFSFLQSTPLPQILVLHTLLLHDGLTEAQYAEITEEPGQQVKASSLSLIQMQDDGLLVRKEDTFFINSLLYRQVVALLELKNFLH